MHSVVCISDIFNRGFQKPVIPFSVSLEEETETVSYNKLSICSNNTTEI